MTTWIVILMLLASVGAADAAIFTSPTCLQQDVATTIGFASDGDTVVVPIGDCPWTSTLTITKMITLQGAGNVTTPGLRTLITDARQENPPGERWVIRHFNITGGTGLFRITGFAFQGDNIQAVASDGFIQLAGCTPTTANYRIDNNRFNQIINVTLRFHGSIYGVTDHNIFIRAGTSNTTINTANESWPRDGVTCTGSHADGSWAFPLPLDVSGASTIRAHYIETNTFQNAPDGPPTTSSVDSSIGSRVVFRYNTLSWGTASSHGTDSGGRDRGQRWMEVYENDFAFLTGSGSSDSTVWIRGGSGIVANNRITMPAGFANNWMVKHLNLRSGDPQSRSFAPWVSTAHPGVFPDCDGTSVWDGNTGTPQTPTGGYRCLDQPGAGTSVDFLDVEPPPNVAAQNTLEPIYVWNNTTNGVSDNCGPGSFGCDSDGVAVAGRDIIYGTARPGYTPFTYPHPLTVGGVPPPPGTPANLTVSRLEVVR